MQPQLAADVGVTLDGRSVLRDVNVAIPPGGIVGLFGESGCGKTTLALALLNLLDRRRWRIHGSVRFGGADLLQLPEPALRRIRGARIALIFQDSLLALNPVMRARDQVADVLRAHGVRAAVNEIFDLVQLPPAGRDAYPHELSGGERQRVLLAQAIACRPELVIADEPFTALDASAALALCALIRDLRARLGTSFLVIAHNPAMLARVADDLLVMYGGSIVERGRAAELLGDPLHPYTAGLLRSLAPRAGGRLYSIPGNPPRNRNGAGCCFAPRCADRMQVCGERIVPEETGGELHSVRCFKYGG